MMRGQRSRSMPTSLSQTEELILRNQRVMLAALLRIGSLAPVNFSGELRDSLREQMAKTDNAITGTENA